VSSSIAVYGDSSAAATAAAEIELVESIAFSAMMSCKCWTTRRRGASPPPPRAGQFL
jgi:hypothetical protein